MNPLTTFYDINGLVDEQVKMLDSISPTILKKAVINGNKEDSKITPQDTTAWLKELAIFKSADINKSILLDSYTKTESAEKNTISYKSKYPEKTRVEELSIQFGKTDQKPLKIHATLDYKNEVFTSEINLEINFLINDGKSLLSNYRIEGYQKMISKDTSTYLIEAEIIYP